jgi:hypothetical protein
MKKKQSSPVLIIAAQSEGWALAFIANRYYV